MYLPMNWKKAPKIDIDHTKCTVPMYCKLCLEACPETCFSVRTVKQERLKESNREEPGAYKLGARLRYNCTMCNKCIEVCPVNAITITA